MSNYVQATEVNFDGLIGPTHNYSGLSLGNMASANHALQTSYPKAAALQGLAKMKYLRSLGYTQGILLPQLRPDLSVLRDLGFTGTDTNIINKAAKHAPELLNMVYSASSMWAANAATVTPSADTPDGKVKFTVANLLTTAHRAIEPAQTFKLLKTIFASDAHFNVYPAFSGGPAFGDEGAANHSRICHGYGEKGTGLFVYGQGQMQGNKVKPMRFPARQSLTASLAVARQHGVVGESLFLQQNPDIIDAGAFHNDVVAVANGPVLFHHESAFLNEAAVFSKLSEDYNFKQVVVPISEVNVKDAISSYLFNSQLLASPGGEFDKMHLIAPMECQETPAVNRYLKNLVTDNSQPIRRVSYVDVRQSMSNGGGPACLRLRVVLTETEIENVHSGFILDDARISELEVWVETHYRESLNPQDLADPALMIECYTALNALSDLFGLDDFYKINK